MSAHFGDGFTGHSSKDQEKLISNITSLLQNFRFFVSFYGNVRLNEGGE